VPSAHAACHLGAAERSRERTDAGQPLDLLIVQHAWRSAPARLAMAWTSVLHADNLADVHHRPQRVCGAQGGDQRVATQAHDREVSFGGLVADTSTTARDAKTLRAFLVESRLLLTPLCLTRQLRRGSRGVYGLSSEVTVSHLQSAGFGPGSDLR
jgi:hypothetical protein